MENRIFSPQKLEQVQWKDLLQLHKQEVVAELMISAPWLLAAMALASFGLWIPALFCAFVFFLTGLRQAHNAYHYALGLGNRQTEWVIFGLSLLMFCSLHAVKYNHLQHHKHCLDDDDIEGKSAGMPWWKALLYGPVFPVELHLKAWRHGNRSLRRWVLIEAVLITVLHLLIFFVWESKVLQFHALAMVIGNCLTAFFAVWTVHHDCEPDRLFARTLRGKFKTRVFYNMFYHTEHHLFPRIPTRHLPQLAARLDKVLPEVKEKQVF